MKYERETKDRDDLEWPAPHLDRIFSSPQFDHHKVAGKLFEAGREQLFYSIPSSEDPIKPREAVLNLATLNRLVSHSLQHKLASQVARLYEDPTSLLSDEVTREMSSTLRAYCTSVQNADLMQAHLSDKTREDPFKVKSTYEIDRDILEQAGLIPSRMTLHGPLPFCDDSEKPNLLGSSRHAAALQAERRRRLHKLVHALGGGLALIVPMLIMIYVPGQTSSVATACGAILLFALVLALKSDLGPNDSLLATAAYAAVLVVFVGLTPSGRES